MDVNWSAFDGILGVILVIVIIWVALKLAKRIIAGAIIVVIIGVVFFGWHIGGLGGRAQPESISATRPAG